MYGLSTADGFMNVKEGVDEMIKYLTNEPSVGLYFVQQHAQASMPYLLGVKGKVVEKVHEVTLHTEDIEDSIYVLKSMTECGLPIADEMIRDINKSLVLMSTSQPKKGLIHNRSREFQFGSSSSSSSNTHAAFGYSAGSTEQNGGSSRGYLSAVFSSAKQKAAGLKWSLPDPVSATIQPPRESSVFSTPVAEVDEIPLTSQLVDSPPNEVDTEAEMLHFHDLSTMLENYDKFKSDREAKLEAWLQESQQEHRQVADK